MSLGLRPVADAWRVCAWCKRLRTEDGSWLRLEEYLLSAPTRASRTASARSVRELPSASGEPVVSCGSRCSRLTWNAPVPPNP